MSTALFIVMLILGIIILDAGAPPLLAWACIVVAVLMLVKRLFSGSKSVDVGGDGSYSDKSGSGFFSGGDGDGGGGGGE
ncbi:hypothetical protein PN836_018830 [Ningiella sp. W23]|uniref:hypothetical protein n=1 Tax=Ningiella sp. W23 TaxID=3023715 RepID=UPI003757CA81